jgi:predicted  nucleic acid-binding Zn-ribbon protein
MTEPDYGEDMLGLDPREETQPQRSEPQELEQRITDYLASGGLFNPEMAKHDRVRDLLIDCRAAIEGAKETAWRHSPSLALYRRLNDEIDDLKQQLAAEREKVKEAEILDDIRVETIDIREQQLIAEREKVKLLEIDKAQGRGKK